MRFNLTLPDELASLYKEFESTSKGRKLLSLTGISREQLDIFSFFKNYFEKDTLEVTIDPNGNVGNSKSNSNLLAEASNSLFKLYSFVDMFYYLTRGVGVSKEETIQIIKDIVTGKFYPHDQSKWSTVPYCIAVSTYPLMVEGRPYGQLHSLSPKRPDSFIAQTIEFVMDLSQEFAGAVAIGDLAVNYAYFLNKLGKVTDKQIENDFQKLVHVVNNTFRTGGDSPFTNVSFFDGPTLRLVFKDYRYPDGSSPLDEPYLSTIRKIQKVWMEFISRKDPKSKLPYRFPVCTVNICVDKDNHVIDEDFFKDYCELNTEGIFNVYIVNDGNARISSCCFHPSQKILVKSSSKGIELVEIGEFLERPKEERLSWRIYHNGSWVKAKPVKVPYDRKWYKITTANKKEIIVTDDHIHVTLDGEKTTTNLKVGDYLMFSSCPLFGIKDREYCNFSYLYGLVVGAFLGDGSFRKYRDKINGVVFCFNHDKYNLLAPIIEFVGKCIDNDISFSVQETQSCILITTHNKNFVEFIRKFVGGVYNYECYPILDSVLKCNYDFRLGLIKGLYLTDGGNNNRIYSTSRKMIEHLEVIFTTLGIPTIIDFSDRRDEPVVIRGKEFSRNYVLYCIRFYSIPNIRSYLDLYKVYNNSIYFKIVKIEELENKEEIAYCVEMENEDEPYFTLPNGIITHNCRLVNDITELMQYKGIDSFGNGGINIGSHRVVTINLPRVALDCKANKWDLFDTLEQSIRKACALLVSHRLLLQDRIKQGFLKFFDPLHWLDLDRMFYSTVGVIGIYEFCEILGYDILTNEGLDFLRKVLSFIKDQVMKQAKLYGIPFNIEQIPGESAAITLAKKDKVFYDTNYVLYSNQFIPLWKDVLLTKRIEIDGKLDEYFGGGVISHLNIDGKLRPEVVEKLTRYAIQKGLRHFAFNLVFSRCENGHFTAGNINTCPACGSTNIEKTTRIVGYFVPLHNWVKERREWEFGNRVWKNLS